MSEIDIVAASNSQTRDLTLPEAIAEEDESKVENQQEEHGAVALQDNLAEASDSDSDLDLRPVAISDQLKVGKHSGDRSVNTAVTELVPLNQLTDSLLQLQGHAAELKREFLLTRGCMQAEFEQMVSGKSLELHTHINEQVARLEKAQLKQLDRARKAHEMELNEAVIKVHRMYDSGFKMRQQQQQAQPADAAEVRRLKHRLLQMEAQVQQLEEEVNRLNGELARADEELAAARADGDQPPALPPPPLVVERRPSGPVYKQSDIDELERKIKKLKTEAEEREAQIQLLTEEAAANAAAGAASAEERERLLSEIDEQKAANASLTELLDSMRQRAASLEEEIRQQLQQELEAAVAQSRESALAEAAAELEAARASWQRRESQLEQKVSDAEQLLADERRANREKLEQLKDVEKLRNAEEQQRRQIARLRAELKRQDLIWEKKFAVLKRSLHAVKDESYLRQTAQRQAAVLHQASVMYAADVPAAAGGVAPLLAPADAQQQQQQQQQHGLMVTGSSSKRQRGPHEQRAEQMSYTASAPVSAGQRTASGFLSDDENQILSEGEELPAGVLPLPDRPELQQ